jgi:TfoX/Sxy family transcriptional regulator of competence genes
VTSSLWVLGASEAVNPRRTDNTMTKRKRTKAQTTIYKTLYRLEKKYAHGPNFVSN